MLHILNGESTETTLAQTAIPGERFSFRDALIGGPTPAGANGADWRKVRAAHLSASYGVDVAECERDLARQEIVFASFGGHEEVVLWFESDLFCQVNMLYVLDWFTRRETGNTKLTLICIGEFPGRPNFRGLGELNPEELASLFEKRNRVSDAEFELARSAWQAYRSDSPRAIEQMLDQDTAALPFLKEAFRLHLERFPSSRNGLGRIERRGMELITVGLSRFVDLFPEFIKTEAGYGLGDAQFWNALRSITTVPYPLLQSNDSDAVAGPLSSDKVETTSFQITETGLAVLNGTADFVEMNGIDLWLGGVHLNGTGKVWRWDEQHDHLVAG
jgi:hypothetical protein